MSLDNIKLASAGGICRSNCINEPCSGQCALFVEEFWIDFSRNGISRTTVAEVSAGFYGLGVGITPLDHELLDHAVEKSTIKIMLFRKLDEILFVFGRFVVQDSNHVAILGSDRNNIVFFA